MPTSLWDRLLAWARGTTPTAPNVPPSAPTRPVSVTPATGTTPTVPVVPSQPTPLPSMPTPIPTQPVPTPAAPPVTPTPVPLRVVLPTEGMNLGLRKLWYNHPTVLDGEVSPCRDELGNPNFDNQCAILMGTCLLRSNLFMGYDKGMCWFPGHKGHSLRAREVADWMRRHPERFGRVEVRTNVTWQHFLNRTGFVCFHNFWGEGNQGDHIDLWDGTGILRREVDPSWEGPSLADGSLDYFERSQEVWFWPVY